MPGPGQVTLPYQVPTTRTQVTYELDDVADQLPANGNLLVYNTARNLYVPRALAAADLGAIPIDALSDVTITAPATGQHLRWNGTQWVNLAPLLDDNSDVTLTAPALGDVLVWNGTQWVNASTRWIAFTPNVKLGVGTVTIANNGSRVTAFGTWIMAEYRFRFANLLGAIGNLTVEYPLPARDPTAGFDFPNEPKGQATAIDRSGPGTYPGRVLWSSTTVWQVSDLAAPATFFWSSTNYGGAGVGLTPGAQGTGDEFYAQVMYEAA